MKTEIEFLERLEADLVRANENARARGVPPRRMAGRARIVLVATTIVLIVAGGIGWSLRPGLIEVGRRAAGRAPPTRAQLDPAAREAYTTPTDGSYGIHLPLAGFDGLELPGPPEEQSGPLESLGVGPKVVKTAHLELEVADGQFDERFGEAALVAGRYGGFVSTSTSEGSEARDGTLEIRVPAEAFDRAVEDLRQLGTIERQTVAGEEVTARFVDLEARIRTWQAQEEVLLRLMGDSRSVTDSLRVQRELQDVQLEIEQLEGQKLVLEDRISMGTILVSLREEGRQEAVASDRPRLSNSLDEAIDGFFSVIAAVVTGVGYLAPVSALLFAAWLLIHRVRRARGLT